jgi:hypothetical protein
MPLSLGIKNKSTLKNYKEVDTSPTVSSGSLTLDLNNGNIFIVSKDQDITSITISNSPSSTYVGNFTLILENAVGLGGLVSWPASIKWPSGSSPTLSTTFGNRDIFAFMSLDGGTSWLGFIAQQDI